MIDLLDAMWQHARWAVEEASNRYGLDVYVRVFSDAYNVTFLSIGEDRLHFCHISKQFSFRRFEK